MSISLNVLDCLNGLERPASASVLQRALKDSGSTIPLPKVQATLDELTASKKAWIHPPLSRNAQPRYWNTSPADYTLTLLQEALAGQEKPVTISQTKERVPKCYRSFVDEALGSEIRAGRLYEFRKGPTRYVSPDSPGPRELLTAAQLKTLKACVDRLRIAGRRRLSLDGLLTYLDNGEPSAPAPATPVEERPTEALLREWHDKDLPSLGGLRTMPFAKTWPRYAEWSRARNQRPKLEHFHTLLRELASKSIVALTPHDEPGRLSPEDQALLLHNADGAKLYYYTILS